MESTFVIWEKNRKIYRSFIETCTTDQLNKVPAGFNNNLIWNIGHAVVVQQVLVYSLSGLKTMTTPEIFNLYKAGSKPEEPASAEHIEEIKELLMSVIPQTKEDYENGVFKTYNPFKTRTGFNLNSATEAIEFNNFHEAVHLGVMMSIRKFV